MTHGGSGCQSVWPHTDVFVHPGTNISLPLFFKGFEAFHLSGFRWFNVGAFDIAMIRLRQPLHFSASIQPAFLFVAQLPAGINLLTAGWGVQDQSHLEQSYFPTYLKKVHMIYKHCSCFSEAVLFIWLCRPLFESMATLMLVASPCAMWTPIPSTVLATLTV